MGSALLAWLIGGGGLGMVLGLAEPLHKSGKVHRKLFRAVEILQAHREQLSEEERQFADGVWQRFQPSDAFRIDLKRGV